MDQKNDNLQDIHDGEELEESSVNPTVIGWGVAAVLFAILALTAYFGPP